MDEPTNHLDVQAKDALKSALDVYKRQVGTCRLILFTIYIYVSENVIPEVQPLYK